MSEEIRKNGFTELLLLSLYFVKYFFFGTMWVIPLSLMGSSIG